MISLQEIKEKVFKVLSQSQIWSNWIQSKMNIVWISTWHVPMFTNLVFIRSNLLWILIPFCRIRRRIASLCFQYIFYLTSSQFLFEHSLALSHLLSIFIFILHLLLITFNISFSSSLLLSIFLLHHFSCFQCFFYINWIAFSIYFALFQLHLIFLEQNSFQYFLSII